MLNIYEYIIIAILSWHTCFHVVLGDLNSMHTFVTVATEIVSHSQAPPHAVYFCKCTWGEQGYLMRIIWLGGTKVLFISEHFGCIFRPVSFEVKRFINGIFRPVSFEVKRFINGIFRPVSFEVKRFIKQERVHAFRNAESWGCWKFSFYHYLVH